jgi:hypothetical protein
MAVFSFNVPGQPLQLRFAHVPGNWRGNDYPKVAMTSVSLGYGPPLALVFLTHMSIDYDGMGNAYGPPNKCPLDNLGNAGWKDSRGYYGVKAYHPKKAPAGVVLAQPYAYYQDVYGQVPAVQQTGIYKDYFISVTSQGVDAGVASFGALHGGLASNGVAADNFGMVLRPDLSRIATFTYLGGEGGALTDAKGKFLKDPRLGECSYRVFLDLGGTPKPCSSPYANNNFQTVYIVFPGSNTSQLSQLALGDDYDDLAAFIAFQMAADAKSRGVSALPAFNQYVASGRKVKPAAFDQVDFMLESRGYVTSGLMEQ